MRKLLLALLALALFAPVAQAVGRDDAAAIARDATDGAEVVRVERDGDVFEVELRGGDARYEVEVLAATGAVLEVEADAPVADRARTFELTEDDARAMAAAVAPEAATGVAIRTRDARDAAYEVFYAGDGALGEVRVDGGTGVILGMRSWPEAAARGALRPDAVVKRVEERQSGARLTELALGWDDGRYVYEGEAEADGRRYSFEIDALTGAFLEFERDG